MRLYKIAELQARRILRGSSNRCKLKCRARARAPVDAPAKRHFREINHSATDGFAFNARRQNRAFLKGVFYFKFGKSSFGAIFGYLFSPKNFYYFALFSDVFRDLTFPFWQIELGSYTQA